MQKLQRLIGTLASGFSLLAGNLVFTGTASFAADAPPSVTLIIGAKIFGGSDKLVADMSVLVEGNKISIPPTTGALFWPPHDSGHAIQNQNTTPYTP